MKRHEHHDHYVEVIGLHCPQPVINCKVALAKMAKGEILKFIATDSASLNEIPRLVESTGDELITVQEIAGHYQYTIRRNRARRKRCRPPVSVLELTGLASLAQRLGTREPLNAW